VTAFPHIRELLLPPSLGDWWARWTAGKRQRNGSGKAQRNGIGKRARNSATNTGCCCGGCGACSPSRSTFDVTLTGVSACPGVTITGTIDGTWTVPFSSGSATLCRFILITPLVTTVISGTTYNMIVFLEFAKGVTDWFVTLLVGPGNVIGDANGLFFITSGAVNVGHPLDCTATVNFTNINSCGGAALASGGTGAAN
jgi:hypothetical protein